MKIKTKSTIKKRITRRPSGLIERTVIKQGHRRRHKSSRQLQATKKGSIKTHKSSLKELGL